MSLQWNPSLPDVWVDAPITPPEPDSPNNSPHLPEYDTEIVGAYGGFIMRPDCDEIDGDEVLDHSIHSDTVVDVVEPNLEQLAPKKQRSDTQ